MNKTINIKGELINFSTPIVMGILNITPDSFYNKSRVTHESEIINRASTMLGDGAKILDIGAFSTRPGATEISQEEEMQRLRYALNIIRKEFPKAILSIDTYRPDVATMTVEEFGADIINDVSEGGITGIANVKINEQKDMFKTMARLKVPYILMSVQSDILSILKSFAQEIDTLHSYGVNDIILDPGFGFGKTLEQNNQILYHLNKLKVFSCPILVGVSRKKMIQTPLNIDATQALNGTTVINTLALAQGASILRVHDVKEAFQAVTLVENYKAQEAIFFNNKQQ